MLQIEDNTCKLLGTTGARLFLPNEEAKEFKPNDDLSFLLNK